jgi:hypothetical protein
MSCFLTGCFYLGQEKFMDVVKNSPSQWSSRDCLTIILSSMVHNLNDNQKSVECIATPFYPSVVMALNQLQRNQHHWTDEEARLHLDEFLRGSSGIYVDWRDGRFVNARGNYFNDQTDLDSLLVVFTLKNTTYPCAPSQVNVVVKTSDGAVATGYNTFAPLLPVADWPCYTPSIVDLGQRIWMLNANGDTLRPKYIEGIRHETLTTPETIFAMFSLRGTERHFLSSSSSAILEVTGFNTQMRFELDVAKMK